MWSQIIFVALLLSFGLLIRRRALFLRDCILLGRSSLSRSNPSHRWRNMILVAFGQKRMFSQLWPALFHFFIYVGFILINLGVAEVILDGLLGRHRVLYPLLGEVYVVLFSFLEVLVLLVILSCVVFLWRRNVSRIARLTRSELQGWPLLDANLILLIELLLMAAILYMNASDVLLQKRIGSPQYPEVGAFLVSQWLLPLLSSLSTNELLWMERSCWWFHIVGVLSFAYYITYSKHLHIFFAFPNTYYASSVPSGVSEPIERVKSEVRAIIKGTEPPQATSNEQFGAKDVTDLSRKQLLEAFTCTECGRCSDVCPAHMSGKLLSPRKIMMSVRDRTTEVAAKKDKEKRKSLFGDYIQIEEINACTTCQACIEACPVQINPMEIILSLRQYVAMETDQSPSEWQQMYASIETNGAPWKFPSHTRADWQRK